MPIYHKKVALAPFQNVAPDGRIGTLIRPFPKHASDRGGENDYDVLAEGVVVGRIMRAIVAPIESPWFWTLAYGYHHDRRPTHGYAATREAAMTAFAKSWGRE